MAGVAHGWKPGNTKAPPVKVAKEFNRADLKARVGALRRKRTAPMPVEPAPELQEGMG